MSDTARRILHGLAESARQATTNDDYRAIAVALISLDESLSVAERLDKINDNSFVGGFQSSISVDGLLN